MKKTAIENIRTWSLQQIEHHFEERGEKKFRARQLYEWIWQKNAMSFADMTNLSKEMRQHLGEQFVLPALSVNATQYSEDGTVKSRFLTWDGHAVEGVLIPTEKRLTACVSSQIGCSLSCKFCATGYMDRKRNLQYDEIVDEVVLLNKEALQQHQKKISNIVFMGMGEPLLNYKQVLLAIEKITSPDALGMSARRITVSTAGVAKGIRQLGDDNVRFKLALSLHAANDSKRNEIMPINESIKYERSSKPSTISIKRPVTRSPSNTSYSINSMTRCKMPKSWSRSIDRFPPTWSILSSITPSIKPNLENPPKPKRRPLWSTCRKKESTLVYAKAEERISMQPADNSPTKVRYTALNLLIASWS